MKIVVAALMMLGSGFVVLHLGGFDIIINKEQSLLAADLSTNMDVQSSSMGVKDVKAEMSKQIPPVETSGYIARIRPNSPEEIASALMRAEELYNSGRVTQADKPVAMVLHGPEVAVFFKDNYERYQDIIDLAAKLSALNVVEVNVCRTRLGMIGEPVDKLMPFVGTVPFGPDEVDRLLKQERYVYF